MVARSLPQLLLGSTNAWYAILTEDENQILVLEIEGKLN